MYQLKTIRKINSMIINKYISHTISPVSAKESRILHNWEIEFSKTPAF
jgi:hypothetical protein